MRALHRMFWRLVFVIAMHETFVWLHSDSTGPF